MQETQEDLTAAVLAALAHPNRVRILECLREDIKCNCELAPSLSLEQSNLSRHLKLLVQNGILISWKEGLRVNFKIADQRVYRILELAKAVAKRGIEKKVEALEPT
ncbi:MAG TPA: metalloregulator ArsR/SmtB family transcription factor [Bacteroidota bacterium]|nr:metalloregulator ArsR/SmtB family transcription factor [Bacteroidota bacterium]